MVGRGTRLDVPSGKLMFHVYDYTDATRLFGEGFLTQPTRRRAEMSGTYKPEKPPTTIIQIEGMRYM